MKTIDFSECISLDEAFEKYKSMWGKQLTPRNNQMMECVKECKSVMELGVHQGLSIMTMTMANEDLETIIGVDINLDKWRGKMSSLVLDWVKAFDTEVIMRECSSTDPACTAEVDMLHIDSLHHADHLRKELDLHAKNVKKYIMFHDINQNGYALGKVVKDFVSKTEWKVHVENREGKCGYMVITR